MDISDIYKYSWFANLSYVSWSAANTNSPAEIRNEAASRSRVPSVLGDVIFAQNSWAISDYHPNDDVGFAGNVFELNGEKVLAIRGTEFDSELLPPDIGDQTLLDLFGADIQDIGLVGLAIKQCVSMFNYVQCLKADTSDNQVLQLTLHTETTASGVEAPTTEPFIMIHHPATELSPFGTDEYFWFEPTYDGIGLGVISSGDQLTVTGHSLGGHLSALAIRLFPELFDEAVIFNSPGFDPLSSAALTDAFIGLFANYLEYPPATSFADLSDRIFRIESEGSAPGDDISVVSSLFTGTPVGVTTLIPTENNSHSMDQLMDALSVLSLLQTLSPDSTISDIANFYEAAAIQSGSTEEELIDSLSMLFLGQDPSLPVVEAGVISHGDFGRRSEIHDHVLEILAAVEGRQLTFMNLAGYSAADLVDLASGSTAIRYALQHLNSFAVMGDDGIYDQHNVGGDLDYAKFSGEYWQNRADFLVLKIEAGQLDSAFLDIEGASVIYVDEPSDLHLARGDFDGAQVVFGSNNAADIDLLEGDVEDDVLFAGFGSDILVGHSGMDFLDGGYGDDSLFGNDHLDTLGDDGDADRLRGGAGDDRYYVGDSDEIVDSDRMVSAITLLGMEITGEYIKVSEGVYRNEAKDIDLIREGDSALIITNTEGQAASIRIFDFWEQGGTFRNGDFRISLIEEAGSPDLTVPGVIIGTEHPDRYGEFTVEFPPISGTTGADIVAGLAGGDQINVYEGHDVVDGATGPDYISSVELLPDSMGPGDFLFGGAGDDVLVGSRSADQLFGGDDDDYLQGRPGNDLLQGEAGADVLNGGAGSDRLVGGDGHDILSGDEIGYPYKNLVWSGDDDYGGPGLVDIPDRYLNRPPDEDGGSNDYLFGGNGRDKLFGDYGDDVLFGGSERDLLQGGIGDDYLEGGDGDDDLIGDDGNREATTGGDDILLGGNGNDRMAGDAGDDSLEGGGGADSLQGGYGEDRLFGDDGDDRLFGDKDDDVLWGGQGDDILDGGEGNDILHGGAGDDVILFGRNRGNDVFLDVDPQAGDGLDVIAIEGGIGTWELELERAGSDLRISLADSQDSVTIQNWFAYEDRTIDRIVFWHGLTWDADDIKAVLSGGGTSAADEYFGSAGSDIFDGNAGDDFLVGDAGNDTLMGGDGNDILLGGPGDDALIGEEGTDELDGGDGDDLLDGGPALLYGQLESGGEGSDAYVFDLGYTGTHLFVETDEEGDDVDAVVFGSGIAAEDLRFGRPSYFGFPGSDLTIDVVQAEIVGGANIIIPGWFEEEGTRIEQFIFSGGILITSDEVDALVNKSTDSHDYLTGGSDSDVIHGFGGNDELFGFGASSLLFGDEGDDRLLSAASENLLFGGEGNDVLILNGSFVPTFSILDGGEGQDHLQSSVAGSTLYIGQQGQDHIVVNTVDATGMILFNKGDGVDYVEFTGETPFDMEGDGEGSSFRLTVSVGGVGVDDIHLRRDDMNLVIEVGAADEIVLSDWFALNIPRDDRILTLQVITQGSGDYDPGSTGVLVNSRIHLFDLDWLIDEFVSFDDNVESGEHWSISGSAAESLLLASDTVAIGGQIAYEFGLLGHAAAIGLTTQSEMLRIPGLMNDGQQLEIIETAPIVLTPIADQEVAEDAPINLTISRNGFETPFGSDELQIAVSIAGSNPLPEWLTFDTDSLLLSGAPQNEDVGQLNIEVTATNRLGEVAVDTFSLTVANTNDAPVTQVALSDIPVERGGEFSLQLPPDVFVDPDIGDEVKVSARVSAGAPLPEWLHFDGDVGRFTGVVPADALNSYEIELIATDRAGATATHTFAITVSNSGTGTSEPNIVGTEGRDRVSGTAANDVISVGAGRDHVWGGLGDDSIYGGTGRDRLSGDAGNDFLIGEDGNDTLFGGEGNDQFDGGAGRDSMQGGGGNDILHGGPGHDQLAGGTGNDVLFGGADRDTMNGGAGDDLYIFGGDDGRDRIVDWSGSDVLRFEGDLTLDDLSFARRGADLIIRASESLCSVSIRKWFATQPQRIERFEFADGSVLLESQVQSLVQAMGWFVARSESPAYLSAEASGLDWSSMFDLPWSSELTWHSISSTGNITETISRHAVMA
ncbi:MAG: putative Ig domain-containing protein [Gammaproteobacteria bacterium]|nr:putative Ig domain-containing protein [Gammaproteobacteria bacterium]